jgi:hypothetical protein
MYGSCFSGNSDSDDFVPSGKESPETIKFRAWYTSLPEEFGKAVWKDGKGLRREGPKYTRGGPDMYNCRGNFLCSIPEGIWFCKPEEFAEKIVHFLDNLEEEFFE